MGKLAGLRIVVTRAAHQAEELATPLRELGAEVLLAPVIGIGPPRNPEALQRAAEHSDEYDWIIFSSANAVTAFAERMEPGRNLKARIAAVGPATRAAAEQRGFAVSLMPERYVAESLAEAFGREDLAGVRVLIPSAEVTRGVAPTKLRERGAIVDVVEAYRNAIPSESAELVKRIFERPYPDWVTFASSSAVEHLIELIGSEALAEVRIASIGAVTSETVRRHGLTVAAEARSSTVQGLVEAICDQS